MGLKFYPASTGHGMQAGLYGNAVFRNGDITVDGFMDYNFEPRKVVADLQIGKRIDDDLYAVIEGRYNGFMPKDNFGVGIGLEWKL